MCTPSNSVAEPPAPDHSQYIVLGLGSRKIETHDKLHPCLMDLFHQVHKPASPPKEALGDILMASGSEAPVVDLSLPLGREHELFILVGWHELYGSDAKFLYIVEP